MKITRRSLLKSSFAAAATAFARLPAFAAARSQSKGYRIFACDWTLGKTCDPGSFAVASRIGLDGVQVDFGRVKEGVPRPPLFDEAHQDRILAASAEQHVPIASLALGVLNNVPYKSDASAEQWVLDSVRVMQRMRAHVTLLAFFSKGDLVDDPAGIDAVIGKLNVLAPRAADAGVVYGFESWLKVSVLERILDAVNSPALRVYYDIGNMQKVGEDVPAAIRRLGRERICEVHLKDYDDLYGKGSMNFPAVREALDAIGYRGWLGVEGVKTPLGMEPSIKYDLEYLRTVFPKPA